MEHPLTNPQAPLMNRLKFSEDDLRANQEGYMTKRQRKRLNAIQRQRAILIILAILTEVVLAVVMTSGQDLTSCTQCSNPTLGLTILMVAVLVFIAYFWFERRKTKQDLYKGEVAVVEGEARYRRAIGSGGRRAMYRSLFINQNKFRVLRWALSAFEHGDTYRVYYTPRSKIILSAEWEPEKSKRGG